MKVLAAPRWRVGPVLVTVLLAWSCAGQVDPAATFPEVVAEMTERDLPEPRWQLDDAGKDAARQRVRELLASDLDADAAVEIALLANPELQAAFEDLGIAQAELFHAGRVANPTLVGAARFAEQGGTNLDLGLSQSLLQLLARPARKKLAGVQLEETRLRVADEVLRLAADTRVAYFEVLGAEQVRQMRALVAEAAESGYRLAERIHRAGNLSDLELANESATFEEARLALGHSQVEAMAARERLTRLMGLSGDDVAWTAAARLPALPAEEPALEALESEAIDRRLDLAAAVRAVEAAATALGISRDWRFLLMAEIGVSAERETDGEWLIGPELGIELPIFDRRQAEIAGHEARLRQRTAKMAALAVEIRSEVRTLRDQLLMTRDMAAHLRDVVVPLRERIVALTQQQYDYMLVGAFELLMAKESEYDAYRDYLEAVRDYWIVRTELARALGGGFPPLPQTAAASPQPVDEPEPVSDETEPEKHDTHQHHQHGGQR